jgi:hypothetical protein
MQTPRLAPIYAPRENEGVLWVMVAILLAVSAYAAIALLARVAV